MKTIRSFLLTAVALAAIAFLAPQLVHAADAAADHGSTLSALSLDFVPLTPLAQVVPADAVTQASGLSPQVSPSTPWYLSTEFFAALFSLAAGIVAVVKDQSKKKAEKINSILVLGIEAATKIPKVAEFEKKIKGDIRQKAEQLGVQPVLDRLVKDLTK